MVVVFSCMTQESPGRLVPEPLPPQIKKDCPVGKRKQVFPDLSVECPRSLVLGILREPQLGVGSQSGGFHRNHFSKLQPFEKGTGCERSGKTFAKVFQRSHVIVESPRTGFEILVRMPEQAFQVPLGKAVCFLVGLRL